MHSLHFLQTHQPRDSSAFQADGSIERLLGTMFRLPLRTEELGAQSLISDGGFVCPKEVEQLMYKVDSMAMDLLMFTKNIKKLTAYIIDQRGHVKIVTKAQVVLLCT